MAIKFYNPLELRPDATVGTWTLSVASSIPQLLHTDADNTSVLTYHIPREVGASSPLGNPKLVAVSLQYAVATAALDAAPTAVFNTLTMATDTRIVSRAAAADTTTFSGTNTVGTAAGTYACRAALDQPLELADNQSLTVDFTINAAATSVVTIRGILIETA